MSIIQKADYSRKFLDYERKNQFKIAQRKASYYQANKEVTAKKRLESKFTKAVDENSTTNDASQDDKAAYSFKRKEIDFTMADLERDAEEDDDEYKAKIEDVGEKSLPSRKCKNATL